MTGRRQQQSVHFASAFRLVDGRLLTPCGFFLWGYLKAKVYERRPLTLEALKEAIRQEAAAITPEMILKFTDIYRKRLHQFINIQGRHLSDVLFKTRRCKMVFCVLSISKKNICHIVFGFEFISFPNMGVLSVMPCIRTTRLFLYREMSNRYCENHKKHTVAHCGKMSCFVVLLYVFREHRVTTGL